jgi:hypothetical protein
LTAYRVVGSSWSTFVHTWPLYQHSPLPLLGVKERLDRNEIVLLWSWFNAAVFAAPVDNPNQVQCSGYVPGHNGTACTHEWDVENDPESGRRFYVAAVTLKNGQVDRLSDPVGVTIR